MGCRDIWDDDDARRDKELKIRKDAARKQAVKAFNDWLDRAGEDAQFICTRRYERGAISARDMFEIRTSTPTRFEWPRT